MGSDEALVSNVGQSDHVMAIVEEHCGGSGLDELVKISVLVSELVC